MRRLYSKIEAWYWRQRGINYSGYIMLMTFRIMQSYIKKDVDAAFIYARVHETLDPYHGKETVGKLCTATYQVCKAGVTEKTFLAFLKDVNG